MVTKKTTTNAPIAPKRDSERGGVGLLIIDMINCFDFEDGDKLRDKAENIVDVVAGLRADMQDADAPVIYVNDNFGEWHSEASRLVERARRGGRGLSARIAPGDEDYFIIKPQFSGFYATNLPVLLPKLGISRLILTGIATDICVLFTAADAHMRDYALWVPEDAVAAVDERGTWALEIMRSSMGAETSRTADLSLDEWLGRLDREGVR